LDIGNTTFNQNAVVPLAIDAAHQRIYVANHDEGKLVVINALTNAKTDVPLVSSPTSVAVNEATNRIYVFASEDNSLSIVDGVTLTVKARGILPMALTSMAVDPATSRILTSNFGDV